MTIYERLQTECKKKGASVTALCLQVTGSSGNLDTWKKNEGHMRSEYLEKCADILGVSTDYLLGSTTSPQSSEFYRTFLSDRGIKAIKKQLTDIINWYGIDTLSGELNISETDIKLFLGTTTPSFDYKCLSILDKMLIALNTNVYDILRNSFYAELVQSNPNIVPAAARSTDHTAPGFIDLTDEEINRLHNATPVTSEDDL